MGQYMEICESKSAMNAQLSDLNAECVTFRDYAENEFDGVYDTLNF